jgi:parallel beta-helix repeat protein
MRGIRAAGIIGLLVISGLVGFLNFGSSNVQGTDVSGTVYDGSGGPWTAGGSPYIVVGNVIVPAGQTLTIDPNVTVKFDGFYSLYVNGTLIAVGTGAERINITSNKTTPSPGDWFAVQINSTGRAEIKFADISFGDYGIYLSSSSNNNISNSNASSNDFLGIRLGLSSNNNITNNDVSNNGWGIDISSSSNNTITGNNISSNNFGGVFISLSSNNTLTGNNISSNTLDGIYLWSSSNNIITDNTVSSNSLRGIILESSSNNSIYHNDIIGNFIQASDDMSDNLWNDTYPSGGNYWDDYSPTCQDLYDGATTPQTAGSPDGICDVQYDIGFNSADYYPNKYATDFPPTIEAWEPGGTPGQTYMQGDLIVVTWTASDDNLLPLNPINITYGIPGIWTSISTLEPNDGMYMWNTTAVPCPGMYWMNLSVYDSIGQTTFDEGNFSFAIDCPPDLPPTIEAWEPGSTMGQTYTQGDLIPVTWTATDDNLLPPNPINITYGNPGTWTTISPLEPNDGMYMWNTAAVPCPGTYWMNLSVYDSIGQTTFDESNYSFDIWCPPDLPPTIEVWEPGGTLGQGYIRGDLIDIRWMASDDNPWPSGGSVVNISYGSTPAGGIQIVNNETEDGLYQFWDTANVACPNIYWINISVYDSVGQTTFDVSNYSFVINCPVADNPPTITAYQPGSASGETYTEGDTIIVTWNTTDDNPLPASPINITFGTAGSWTTIANNQPNDGSYSWDTTGVICPGSYKMNISVRDSTSQTTFEESNYSFLIDCVAVDEGEVTGKVVDKDGNPIEGATVVLKDDSGSTVSTKTTNSAGTYTFLAVDFGLYTMEVSASGYIDAQTSQFTVNSDESMDDIVMTATQPPPPEDDWLSEYWWLLVLIAVVVILLILFLLLGTKKKPSGEEDAPVLEPSEGDESLEGADEEPSDEGVQFGDGATGERLPEGQDDVVEEYRKGISEEGERE